MVNREGEALSLLALAVARRFLLVSKMDSLRLYGSVAEDGTPNGPPWFEFELSQCRPWQLSTVFLNASSKLEKKR
jgi:hypothetical protein